MYIVSYSRIFIHVVQVSSLATAYIGQSLLPFWSHTEQTWMFSLIFAALKIITYRLLFCGSIA